MSTWNQARIQQYIDDEIEEDHRLDYKAADALQKTDSKRKEITKDVSAMANSDGGLIVYGVSEFQESDKSHLPERIDQVDRIVISKEWLEQVINNIRPRIDGVIIHSVSVDTGSNDVVYIVEIPQSVTAHQAMDKRYYKRFNFESIPMEDYEIRDVMNREKAADLDLEWRISSAVPSPSNTELRRLKLRPFLSSKNLITSEQGILKVTIAHPLKFYRRTIELLGLRLEETGLTLPGYDEMPLAEMIKVRWGTNLGGAIFPGDWNDFNGLSIPLEYRPLNEEDTYLLLAELFTANSKGKQYQYRIDCSNRREPTISVVPPEEYSEVVTKFWATFHRAGQA